MIVGAAGDQLHAPGEQPLGQRLGVVGHRLGVALEARLPSLGEGHRLGGHDMTERSAQHHRTAAIDAGGVLGSGQHETAARPAQ